MNWTSRTIICTTILLMLNACDKNDDTQLSVKNNSAELEKFLQQVKSELVFVKGGEFLMGDYGEEYGLEHLPYDSNKDSKPLHKVELSSYWFSRFKTNNEQYQFYLSENGLPLDKLKMGRTNKKYWDTLNSIPNTPAHLDWYDAEKYCSWLAEKTKLPFSLPTEAQWEFAARNRGKYIIAPTNDGTIRADQGTDSNVASETDTKNYAKKMGTTLGVFSPLPGDLFPPNPLGIYDMAGNGFEWMKDWYDPDYYKSSPVKDPQGPEKPMFKGYNDNFTKVLRSQDFSGPGRGLTVIRHSEDPNNDGEIPADKTVRCVVNSPDPIQ